VGAAAFVRDPADEHSQLLELLLEMNDNTRVPPRLRFDLRDASARDADAPPLDVGPDPDQLQRKLQELRNDMVNGIITPEEFARLSDQLHSSKTVITNRALSILEAQVPHSTRAPEPLPEGLNLGEHASGYMSPAHEEEYLHSLDVALADPNYDPNTHDARPIRIPSSRPVPTEKELSMMNPDSVYNWLRKHQPQVFLQDKDPQHPENVSEKSTARPANAPNRGKRPSGVGGTPGPKGEPDVDEEPGFVPETGTASAKGKRGKTDEDTAYRPKGGSSRGNKRKREDGDPVTKGGRKKNRPSTVSTIAS
jgi:hypothetical protein